MGKVERRLAFSGHVPGMRRRPVGLVELDRFRRDAWLHHPQCCLHVAALNARGVHVLPQGAQCRFLADGHNLPGAELSCNQQTVLVPPYQF